MCGRVCMCVDGTYQHTCTHLKIFGYVLGCLIYNKTIYNRIKAKSVYLV